MWGLWLTFLVVVLGANVWFFFDDTSRWWNLMGAIGAGVGILMEIAREAGGAGEQ